jgi:ribosomal protein S18 acetylase RimI-like enzyme
MKIQIRPLKRSDTVQVVCGWCTCFPYDKTTVARFEDTIFEDPNYERQGNLVATKNDEIVGFVATVVREGIAGRDGADKVHEEDFGYIKGLFTLKEHDEKEEVKRRLLEKALDFMKSKNKRTAKAVRYTGRYFFPGIDTRYEEELRFYRENDFEKIDTEEDVAIDLIAFQRTEYQRQAQRRIQELGVVIKPYQSNFLEAMRRFAKRLDYPQWFPEGWELGFAKKADTLVALLGFEVVGWAAFGYPRSTSDWYFGPIAVLEELRRKGIGTCLLLRSMERMKKAGAPNVIAGWANVPFYTKNGWKVSRKYSVLQRTLK